MDRSTRSMITALRTYHRPVGDGKLEDWFDVINRVISHTRKLWVDAGGVPDDNELEELAHLMYERKVLPAGRTLWLGGTDLAYRRPICQFNCAGIVVRNGHDLVDFFWGLLNGAGEGAKCTMGCLQGFVNPLVVEIIPSTNAPDYKGPEENEEKVEDNVWTIKFGDSAEAWARAIGKLAIHRYPNVDRLVLDFSAIRGAGHRLEGYGWISVGYKSLADACLKIANIFNKRVGTLLTEIDIHDILNLLGTVLSTRRSAEIMLMDYHNPRWKTFASMKDKYWEHHPWRDQSNNSLIFWHKPTKEELRKIFDLMIETGGCEPGFINGQAAQKRAPWFATVNPCAEILLTDKGFCNLVEIDLAKFKDDFAGLLRATYLIARLNYRQTCVDLNDGILQPAWHQNNKALRLCGVSLTGIVRNDLTEWELKELRNQAIYGAYSMADELGLERPKNVTTGKPSGTHSKVMDTTEGIHMPLGKYILNWIGFDRNDPLVNILKEAKYRTMSHPTNPTGTLVCFPAPVYSDVPWTNVNGKLVNNESAVDQLERYKKYMINWCDQNMSNTISYDISEVDDIIDWLFDNWDNYVGVSWLFRNDPTKSPQDLGVAYLPQEVVTEEKYWEYVRSLDDVDISDLVSNELLTIDAEDCPGGVCPVR